jgi:hypothetical protein
MPSPVMRMAPNPRRLTVMSPAMVKVPELAALGVVMRDWIPGGAAAVPDFLDFPTAFHPTLTPKNG